LGYRSLFGIEFALTGLRVRKELDVSNSCDLLERHTSFSEGFCDFGVANASVSLDLANFLFPEQIQFKFIRSQAFFLSLPALVDVVYPLKHVHLLRLTLRQFEVCEWPHLGVYECVSEN
jgi:hypothetical protein